MKTRWAATITVAICTWNRASLLRQTLESLSQVEKPTEFVEVIVIDNDSTDDTAAVMRELTPGMPVRYIFEGTPGLSAARNRAILECRTSYLAFTDDDVQPDAKWLTALALAIRRHPEAAGFGGPIEPWFPVAPDPDLLVAFPLLARGFCAIDHGNVEGELRADQDVYGANMAFSLARLGDRRFDTRLGTKKGRAISGEETKLGDDLRRAGEVLVWVPDMRVQHYVDPSRMTESYLTRFYRDTARGHVRRNGPPRGRRLAGVPRWLFPVLARSWLRSLRPGAGRIARLVALREYNYFRGLVEESWRVSREQHLSSQN